MDTFNLWYLWIALAFDVATTWYAMERGGSEANPVLNWAMKRIGVGPALIVSHVLVGAFAWWQAAFIGPHWLWFITAVFAAVVAWNLRVIFKH